MERRIIVLGLGTSGIEALPLGIYRSLQQRGEIWLQIAENSLVKELIQEGINVKTCDDLFEKIDSLEDIYSSIVDKLLEEVMQVGEIFYGIVGDSFLDISVCRLLREAPREQVDIQVIQPMSIYPLDSLIQVMEELRGPKGCPWDKEQTHESLKRYLVEEAYEVIEAIELGNMHRLCEELGDLLLQIVFHAQLAREKRAFGINEVIISIVTKMKERHPHVFGFQKLDTAGEVLENWERIKDMEKARRGDRQTLMDVPRGLPALLRAEKIQARASRIGFDWPDLKGVWAKVEEEKSELLEAVYRGANEDIADEFGDLLFALVNVARFLDLDPEEALGQTVDKFVRRFRYMEQKAGEQGQNLDQLSLAEMDRLWDEAKQKEKTNGKNYCKNGF